MLYTDINSKKIIPAYELGSFAIDIMDMEASAALLDDGEEGKLAAAVYFHMESLVGSMIALEQWQTALANRPE